MSWSRQTTESDHGRLERFRLGYELFQSLGLAAGETILFQTDALSVEFRDFRQRIGGSSGVLFTRNDKRFSESYSLVVEGECVGCMYKFGKEILEESVDIKWRAVERDLKHERTTLCFRSLCPALVTSAVTFLDGDLRAHCRSKAIRHDVERLIRECLRPGESAVVLCRYGISYFARS